MNKKMYIYKKIRKNYKKLSQKYFSIGLLFVFIMGVLPDYVFGDEKGYFVVTAYYSPLPNQEYYLTGDYESEKRLNGQGIRGASGKPVFSGMLAAPKIYDFGTKIELEGLGIGSVEDRGGAIVKAGQRGYSYDRIDVWVGYGDEGLKRALYWGKRTIKGRVVSKDTQTTLNYKTIASPDWATNGLQKTDNIFHIGIGKNSNISDIKELQKFLTKIGKYNGEINGIYSENIMKNILDFQLENELVANASSYGAGYWGTKTRGLFLQKYLNGEFDASTQPKKEDLSIGEDVSKKDEIVIENLLTQEVLDEKLAFFHYPAISQGEIKKLQEVLTHLGYYNGELDGNKASIIDPIFQFQISNMIVNTQFDIGAGTYGPKTRSVMKDKYEVHLKQEESVRQEKLYLEKRKKDLENKIESIQQRLEEEIDTKIMKLDNIYFGVSSDKVRNLQNILGELGYFDRKSTGYFGNLTKESIVSFQVNTGIIDTKNDVGAGVVGPKTKEILKQQLLSKYLEEEVKKLKEKMEGEGDSFIDHI